MFFGRNRNAKAEQATAEAIPEEASQPNQPEIYGDYIDEWIEVDQARDWREDGPFDISEVDLDADEIERIDFGALIITPFPGMEVQLNLNQATQKATSILITSGNSALELYLSATPVGMSMLPDLRKSIIEATNSQNGTLDFQEGPFGVEAHRVVPVTTPDGKQLAHISKFWAVEGPRWLLRGMLLGEVANLDDPTTGPGEPFYHLFANTVVRRGNDPAVPGAVIELNIPEQAQPVTE